MKRTPKKLVLVKETIGKLKSLANAAAGGYSIPSCFDSCDVYCVPQPISDGFTTC